MKISRRDDLACLSRSRSLRLLSWEIVTQVQKEREIQECPECPVMVGIPAGTFVMGSPHSESGRFDSEGPQHEVAIKAFALGKYDVTASNFSSSSRRPATSPAPAAPSST